MRLADWVKLPAARKAELRDTVAYAPLMNAATREQQARDTIRRIA
jgi:hypothetical protein